MIRATFWTVLLVLAGIGLFAVKYEVRDLESRLSKVTRELAVERESAHVLKAEWAYLSRPQRIESLAARFLELQPLQAGQTITINQLLTRLDAAALARHAAASQGAEWSSPASLTDGAARMRKSP